jgi:hypothetical protein
MWDRKSYAHSREEMAWLAERPQHRGQELVVSRGAHEPPALAEHRHLAGRGSLPQAVAQRIPDARAGRNRDVGRDAEQPIQLRLPLQGGVSASRA